MMTMQTLTRLDDPAADYEIVRAAIAHLSAGPDRADLDALAADYGLSPRQLGELFRRWCGLTPKSFAQAVALDHARRLLEARASVLETAFEVGLSSPSRLHDLFVAYESVSPGAYRARGAGLEMDWGVAPSPFGTAVATATPYGLSGLGFADGGTSVEAAFADLALRWPEARFTRNDARIAALVAPVFDPARWSAERPVRIVLIGTDFEVTVWQALLSIPLGTVTTYGELAAALGRPGAARAVGAAVGRNPVSFVVPCHRVVGSTGRLTGYHWGVPRKQAILGWEAGQRAARG